MNQGRALPSTNVHKHLLNNFKSVPKAPGVVDVKGKEQTHQQCHSSWEITYAWKDDLFLEDHCETDQLINLCHHEDADCHSLCPVLLCICDLHKVDKYVKKI